MAKYEDELVLKDSVSDKLDKITGKMNIFSGKSEKIKNVFTGMANGIASAAGLSIASVGALALSCSQAARDAEELKATMDLLTGSSEKSKKVFEDLDKEVGLFSRETLRGLSVQLLDNGVSTEKLIPTLKMLEGFSMGSSDNLQKLTDSLTKVSSTGRVTAQSLKALSAIGIDGQKEMQKQLGVTPKLFNKLLSAGRVTFEDYERLLTRVYNSTDKYNQSVDKLSGTLNGRFDILRNKVGIVGDRLKESLGNIALPYLEKIVTKATDWADSLNNLPLEKVEKLNEVFDATGKLINGIWWVVKQIIGGFGRLYNIVSGFVSVLTSLGVGGLKFAEDFGKLSYGDMLKGLWNGDILDRVEKANTKNINDISSGQSFQTPIPQNTTNMTNTFNINGTVREEADITKIGNAIADRLQMTYINQGSY